MKKTFEFLNMAALLVVGAIMTGCSSDDNFDRPLQPANNDNVVTLTATVSLDGAAGTRAINGTTGAKTFESGKQIAVFYEDASGNLEKAVSTDFTPLTDATKATFTVTLSTPKSGGKIRYIYPASMAKILPAYSTAYPAAATIDDVTINYSGIFGSQDGTLTTLADYDLAVKDAALSGTDQPATVTLTNPLAICKFTLTDGSNDITSSVNSLTISDGTNGYKVTPSDLDAIYVAMKPASGNIAFTARTTDSKTYFKTATGTSLVASTLYTNITVGSMVELALGKVFCSDGSVYADASAATTAGKSPVAKIAYLGDDAETNTAFKNGLALALEDVSKTWPWCLKASVTCLGTGLQFDSEAGAKGDMAGIANTDALVNKTVHTHRASEAARGYNSGTHPAGTSAWFLPSAGQWNKMFTAAPGYENLKTNAGLQENTYYWTSTEYDASKAWVFRSKDGSWTTVGKLSNFYVRACLAF